jgi:carbon monoxide dehydrogenase subunit G
VRLENSFEVVAPVERAWALLNDVPRVVPCMPGAELTETIDENRWKSLMHVKLGPISLQFDTDVVREAEDPAAHSVVLATKARELRGRGGAQARIESSLSEVGGKTRVDIVTDLTLQGAVAQYGRGIVPDVAAQLTKQFAENIASLLEHEPAASESPTGAAPPVPEPVKPVSGLGVGLRAFVAALRRAFRRA